MSEIMSRPCADGIPFAPPANKETQQAKLERWALYMAIGATAALLVTLVVGFVLLIRFSRRLEAADTTLDGLIAAHLYQSYLTIGLLADGAEGEAVYTELEAHRLLDTIIALLDRVDQLLNRLTESGVRASDADSLERHRRLSALLRTQTRELRAYWRTGDRDQARRFQRTREQSWNAVKEILELSHDMK
jgi:hypothetical protein